MRRFLFVYSIGGGIAGACCSESPRTALEFAQRLYGDLCGIAEVPLHYVINYRGEVEDPMLFDFWKGYRS